MNTRLLRSVQKRILEAPLQFGMAHYFQTESDHDEKMPAKIPNCGTAACIAGWAISIKQRRKLSYFPHGWYLGTGQDVLQLTYDQAERLFTLEHWPKKFATLYRKATAKRKWRERAKVAVRRIEHFIETKGDE